MRQTKPVKRAPRVTSPPTDNPLGISAPAATFDRGLTEMCKEYTQQFLKQAVKERKEGRKRSSGRQESLNFTASTSRRGETDDGGQQRESPHPFSRSKQSPQQQPGAAWAFGEAGKGIFLF